MHRFILSLALLPALAPAVVAADPPGTLTPDPPRETVSPASYRIAPEDVLEITVLNQLDLTKTVTVLPDGKISYPYLGETDVAGLTLSELTRRITAALNIQFVNPQVTVSVSKRREKQISVLGAVKTPGKRVMKDGWRVLDVIADCGGLSVDRPEWVSATLVRGGAQAVPVNMVRLLAAADPKENLPLEAGDVLLVQELDPSHTQVQVLGEVVRPGPVPVPRDGSVVAVITAAGGATPRAALSRATILRGGTSVPADLRGLLTDGKVAAGIKLEPGDTLVIPQNKLWFAVFGAVQKPGYEDYPDNEIVTVLSALSKSGGQVPGADLKNASLVRPSKEGKPMLVTVNLEDVLRKGDLSKDIPLQPGDILYLPDRKQRTGLRLTDILSFIPFVSLIYR